MMIEVALMIVIIGVGAVAMAQFLTSATSANAVLSEYPQAIAIARAGHEWARAQDVGAELLPYFIADASAPGGFRSYTPQNPSILGIGSTGASPHALITTPSGQQAYQGWSQQFTIRYVQINQPTQPFSAGEKDAVELTVTAVKDGKPVCNLKRIYYLD